MVATSGLLRVIWIVSSLVVGRIDLRQLGRRIGLRQLGRRLKNRIMGNCFGSTTAATNTQPNSNTRPNSASGGPPTKKRKVVEGQKYVTEAVLNLRDQAETYHEKVVSCAKESQAAYQKGDKQQAKTLSDQKKSWQQKQTDANDRAAKLILNSQKWQSTGELDLHGLFVEEAIQATEDFLKFWSKKQRDKVLIITGAGHHSDNQKAVIRPKVEQLLRKQKLQYESVHGDGAFQVYLKPSQ